jgi:hypothetical protein
LLKARLKTQPLAHNNLSIVDSIFAIMFAHDDHTAVLAIAAAIAAAAQGQSGLRWPLPLHWLVDTLLGGDDSIALANMIGLLACCWGQTCLRVSLRVGSQRKKRQARNMLLLASTTMIALTVHGLQSKRLTLEHVGCASTPACLHEELCTYSQSAYFSPLSNPAGEAHIAKAQDAWLERSSGLTITPKRVMGQGTLRVFIQSSQN